MKRPVRDTTQYAVGLFIEPTSGQYLVYKLLPNFNRKDTKTKPRVELCTGLLHRAYDSEDQFLFLRSKKTKIQEFASDDKACEFVELLKATYARSGWTELSPAYPRNLLETPWKQVSRIRL